MGFYDFVRISFADFFPQGFIFQSEKKEKVFSIDPKQVFFSICQLKNELYADLIICSKYSQKTRTPRSII